jgi:hypothetical protein
VVNLDWSRGRWGAGGTVSIFSDYDVTPQQQTLRGVLLPAVDTADLHYPASGGSRIPAQAYLDVYASLSDASAQGHVITYRLDVRNLLDASPPRFASVLNPQASNDYGLGYSYYGDPHGQIISLTVSAAF